jgi:hypothetical protein
MSKCEQCGTEYEQKRSTSKYCGSKCRKLAFQAKGEVSVPVLSVPSEYETIENAKVYGRQAVKYAIAEPWDLRPEPLNPDDKPTPNNRCYYTRQDGTAYMFDCTGQVFELTNGKVYPKMADLRQAQVARLERA